MEILRKTGVFFNTHVINNIIESSRLNVISFNEFRRNICNSSPRFKLVEGQPSYGDYTEGPDVKDVLKQIWNNPKLLVENAREMKEDFKLLRKEFANRFHVDAQEGLKGEIDMLFTFEADSDIEKFRVITDKSSIDGFSTASFVRTQKDSALFYGNIDNTVPKDGKSQFSGFAGIMTPRLLKSFRRCTTYNWDSYTHLVLKIRGDGRTYTVVLGCPGKYDIHWQDQYHYPLYTRGGPYWQLVKIPFSNFYFTNRGMIQDTQQTMDTRACSRVGITLAGCPGPFKFEIEYIGLEHQPFHRSICPYEEYTVGLNVAG